ncbi:MAG: hypothetical protein HZC42_08155 [Candidatus Eisenbacteria bacterium]|nr:hypothetical protein [Candidatus Eisenbacteria bacterium]
MRRVRWLVALVLLFTPGVSHAIRLDWSSGADTLTFTEATRAILVLRDDSAEVTLPPEWRLLWVGDSTEVEVVALDSLEICEGDTAQVSGVDGGKCKVVALDPADSTAVFESNEVTFNGGVSDPYPPVVLYASSSHPSTQFVVRAVGTGLGRVVGVMVHAPDSVWSLPSQITEQNDSTLTAVAEVYPSMPASVLRLTSEDGAIAVAPLPPDLLRAGIDPDFEALADSCRQNHCYYFDPDPNVYPKDFAFFYAIAPNPPRGLFHLFYIRNHKNVPPSSTTRSFGHAWSSDLRNWESDTSATVFSVSANAWDRAHVWAPSIVQVGPNYHMFYTGVDDQANPPTVIYGNQRIGYATTAAIDIGHATVWTRRSSPTYTVNHTGWARKDSTGSHRHQFRDPFIMADPDSVGRFLLFMVGEKEDADYAVGVARNEPGTLDVWRDLGFYRSTEYDYSGNGHTVESVTAFPDSAYPATKTSAQATWRLLFTHGINSPDDQTIRFSAKKLGPVLADTTLGPEEDRVWSTPATNLFSYLAGDSTAWGTYATEHLRVGRVDFLSTFDGAGILVSRMLWNGTNFTLLQPSVTAVGGESPSPESRVALRVIEALPGAGRLAFEINMPTRERVRLGIYDVAGRRVRSLIDDQVPAGTVRVQWDGKDQAGNAARTGMYFARLSGDFGRRVVRAAFIR